VQRRVYGATKQGAAFGHAKIASKPLLVRGLNALVATVSTPPGRTGRGGRAVAGRQLCCCHWAAFRPAPTSGHRVG
jgi:hypothetical protein